MMYTITRGPSKLVTQRRTGPTQQIENKINDLKHKQTPWSVTNSPAPKIVFNRLNGKRYHTSPTPQGDTPAEGFTAAHEENVKFVYEAWQEVEQQLGDSGQAENGQHDDGQAENGQPLCSQGPVQYSEKTPNPSMKNFVPIDLEEWWAQRFLANIANLA
ncbi:MAPK regulated corepressor interacting protein 2-like [Megalops cyprinoides]|uniref:MAPK regulated corepressor interacting protein 2-like n=1 Tax=Megalops cyprinoides TaxID=118141 RepID=UPI0018641181|nr:MAPK regulated corepressor interacting protein 2-like [Megalops cyprinoides]